MTRIAALRDRARSANGLHNFGTESLREGLERLVASAQ